MVIYSSQNMRLRKGKFDLIKKDLIADKKKFDEKINVNIRNKIHLNCLLTMKWSNT